MSEQATETEDEIETLVTDETETTEETSEDIEIIVEGEDTPTSKSQVPYGVRKRFNKLNGKIAAANTEADEERQKADFLREENRLLRLQAEAKPAQTRPDEDDFDTRAEYLTALDDYDGVRIAKIAQEQAAQYAQQHNNQATQATHEAKFEESLGEHYERANTLKMKNYEELEDKAIDTLGNDFSKVIMANTEKSHLIMAHLGANPVKAAELVELVKTNPVKALVRAVEIGNSLSIKPKTSSPDPETKVDSGVAVSDWQKRIDKARDKAAESGDMKSLIALKREAKDSGIKIR